MELEGIPYQECHSVGTVVHMAVDGEYVGHILIADLLKPHAEEAIRALKVAGIKKTVMLTGDAKRVADKVAANLGIDEVHSELLPGDKVAMVENCCHRRMRKRNWPLWVTVLMMHRYFQEQISVLRWVLWDLMQPLKQRILF